VRPLSKRRSFFYAAPCMCVYWLQSLLQCLWLYGPRTEGVFRHCASVKTCRKWRDALDVGCSSLHVDSAYVHVAASLLKVFTPVSCNYRQFLSRVSTLTLDIDIAILPVRPSVCLSVRDVSILDENGLTYCHIFHRVVAQSF